jgi:hypothetical protein
MHAYINTYIVTWLEALHVQDRGLSHLEEGMLIFNTMDFGTRMCKFAVKFHHMTFSKLCKLPVWFPPYKVG